MTILLCFEQASFIRFESNNYISQSQANLQNGRQMVAYFWAICHDDHFSCDDW